MMRSVILIFVLALSACATRPPLEVACNGFHKYVMTLPEDPIERAIDESLFSLSSLSTAMAPTVASLSNQIVNAIERGDPRRRPAALLLTGGGQWGAFGAGFLKTLRETRPDEYPDFRLITGVSTGAMQALMLAAEDGDAGGELEALRKLAAEYSLPREKDYVHRGPMFMAALTGSVAGLGPLRRRIESALCANPSDKASEGSCLLRAIARSNRVVLIGFVEADSGEFQFVDVVNIAKNNDLETARTCLAGAVLASAAIPVFFQTVKVDGVVYYDGGVRLSVFEGLTALALRAAEHSCTPDSANCRSRLPTYVLRNGPTRLAPLKRPLARDALSTAMRAETLMVNQLEITSISRLRLANPRGEIYLRTANDDDDSEVLNGKQPDRCEQNNKRAMFEPKFMSCLMRFGERRAKSENPWNRLPPISTQTESSSSSKSR